VEPDRWYYWCDKIGLLVWQDMPSGNYNTPDSCTQFEVELKRMVEGRFNHPSIVVWVLFNEGWGQYDTERLVSWLKAMDPWLDGQACGRLH
jgi:beta-galactosidase/beta-glucuronidase